MVLRLSNQVMDGGHEEKHEADEQYQVATKIEERARGR
jgi:hypothetical protein